MNNSEMSQILSEAFFFFFFTVPSLHGHAGFSLVAESGGYSPVVVLRLHCGGFSWCRSQALELGSVVVAQGVSCP